MVDEENLIEGTPEYEARVAIVAKQCREYKERTMQLKEEEERVQPMLKLITGGKGPPTTSVGNNWLKDLKKGAVFTCKRKGMTSELELLIVAFKHDKTIVLVDGLNGAPRRAVDPFEFCKQYDWFETIQEAEQLPEEHLDDTRTVRPSGMDDDADAEGRQPSDDGARPTEA